jgi:hypothetical protein
MDSGCCYRMRRLAVLLLCLLLPATAEASFNQSCFKPLSPEGWVLARVFSNVAATAFVLPVLLAIAAVVRQIVAGNHGRTTRPPGPR